MARGQSKLLPKFYINGECVTRLGADFGEVVAQIGLQVEGHQVRCQSEEKPRQQGLQCMSRYGWGEVIVTGGNLQGLVSGPRGKR